MQSVSKSTWCSLAICLYVMCSTIGLKAQAGLPLSVKLQVAHPSCYGQFGLLSILASGGTPPYTYLVNGQVSTPSSNRLSGNYSVQVCDALNQCVLTSTQVIDPPALTVFYTLQSPACLACLYQLQCYPSGGTPGYSFFINGGIAQAINFLSPGNYIITVSDQQGCLWEKTFKIGDQKPIGLPSKLSWE